MTLHWVVHNRPDLLDVRYIFDDSRVLPNGAGQAGGAGKFEMYTATPEVVLNELQYLESPVLTKLIRELFGLFQSLAYFNNSTRGDREPAPKDVNNVDKLKNCRVIVEFMEAAVTENLREVDDKAVTDNYPRQPEPDRQDLVGKAHVRVSIYSGGEFPTDEEYVSGQSAVSDESAVSRR